MDPNDPRNSEILALKQLVHSAHSDSQLDIHTLHEYWSSKQSFRLNLPLWLERLVAGVGVGVSIFYVISVLTVLLL